jgi:hypothetical protein
MGAIHFVDDQLRAQGEALLRETERQRLQGSDEVAARLSLLRADQVAHKTLFSSRGLREGAIRRIDTSDVPSDVADQVLARYGFRTLIAKVDGELNGGYLSGATTPQGQFVNSVGKGVWRILRYGEAAVRHMMRLEDEALRAQGYDPERTRVVRVEFGIGTTATGHDLVVKRIEVEPVPPASGDTESQEPAVRRVP